MAVNSDNLLVEGFLDVKAPRGSNDRSLIKVWRRLWVSFSLSQPVGRGEPGLILKLSRGFEEEPKKLVKASRDGLRLFRCRSSSRPFSTWALTTGSSLLFYFAAETEAEAQRWIKIIRDGLWPPILSSKIMCTQHEVSLIDDEKSFAIGILGTYGRLNYTEDNVISLLHPHWGGVLLRWPLTDILDIRLIRKVGENVGVFCISLKSDENKESRNLQFYSDTAEDVINWVQSLLIEKNEGHYLKMQAANKHISGSNKVDIPIGDRSEASALKKNVLMRKTSNGLQQAIEKSEGTTYGKINPTVKNLIDIPDDFLNASISNALPQNTNRKESSSDEDADKNSIWADLGDFTQDATEHVYEEINPEEVLNEGRKTSRGFTVYEKMDSSDDEYVPPMPPVVPNRPIPNNELINPRLQRLSESVAEALKQAENPSLSSRAPKAGVKKVLQKSESFHINLTRFNGTNNEYNLPFSERRNSESNAEIQDRSLI